MLHLNHLKKTVAIVALALLSGCASGITVVKPIEATTPPAKIGVTMFGNCRNSPACVTSGARVSSQYAKVFDGMFMPPAGESGVYGARASQPMLDAANKSGFGYLVEGGVRFADEPPVGSKRLYVDVQVTNTKDGSVVATQVASNGSSVFGSIEGMSVELAERLKKSVLVGN